MKKSLLNKDNLINIFFYAALGGALISILCLLTYQIALYASADDKSQSFNWLLGIFSDFVEIMNVSIEESPYIIEGSSYPPLAIIILYPFALICKGVFAKYTGQTLTVVELTSKLTATVEFWIALLLFFFICASLIIFILSKWFNIHGATLFKMSVIIIISAPFVYAFIRGNSILIALIFVMLFLLHKDSKNAILREISYVCLAISGCLKIYPLFFGVFLLKDKKVLASLRVALYFFAIFFAAFFFFERDLNDIAEFTDNLGGFMSNEKRLLGTNNLSLSALVFKLLHLFAPSITSENTVFTIVNISVVSIIFLLSTAAAIITKNDLTRLIICSSVVVLIPSISYFYVLSFTFIPFLEFVLNKSNESIDKRRNIYFYSYILLYSTLLVIPVFFIPHSIIIITLLLIEIVSVFKNEIFNKKMLTN